MPHLSTSGAPLKLPNRGWIVGAAVLAGCAVFNTVTARRAEAKNPPVGKFVEVDGVRMHYVDRGAGPTVVLLHGNGVMLQDYEVSGVFGLAAEHHRVIAFDRPGFGYSERPRSTIWTPAVQADLIARALQQIGVKRAVVVGHSWGTLVALAMGLDRPQLVTGLVLLSGYYYGSLRPDVVPASAPAIPILGDVIANTLAPINGRMIAPLALKAAFRPAPISKKLAAFPASLTLRPSQLRAAAADTAMMIPSAIQLSGRYSELNLPVIIMAGEGDVIAFPGTHARRLVEDLSRAELRVVPEQGHLFHYAVPEQVVAAIRDVQSKARSGQDQADHDGAAGAHL